MIAKYSFYLLLLVCIFSCKEGNKHESKTETTVKASTASSYDLLHPKEKWALPEELKEVSGLSWIDNTHFLVIEDLHPQLYTLRLGSNAVIEKTIPFKLTDKEKFDIEDVAMIADTVYALWSHGAIFKITGWQTEQPDVKKYPTQLSKENNTEGLCYDPVSHHLLIACKDESAVEDEKKSTRAIYEFDQSAGVLKPGTFLLIHKRDFKKLADEKFDFYPSAIAVQPGTNDIYILSTKDTKCMAVYNREGSLKSFQLIDKELMPQPEGICFSPDGTLYISTQGRHGESPMIYKFGLSQ